MKITIAIPASALLVFYFTIGTFAYPKTKLVHKFSDANHAGLFKSKKKHPVTMSIAEVTKNLQFDFSHADVQEEYIEQLNQLAILLNKGNYALALRGHADSIGTYVGNWKLSEKRAMAVKAYLLSKGVQEDKIITTPFGSTVPIASNKTKEGRKKNRRVEFKLQPITNQPSANKSTSLTTSIASLCTIKVMRYGAASNHHLI